MRTRLEVLYEDNHLIAVNKSAGDLVQGDQTGDVSLDLMVKDYIGKKYNKPGDVFLGVIHRIDRPVSGVVVFARTSKALTRMNELFRNKEIRKTYWCIVKEMPVPVLKRHGVLDRTGADPAGEGEGRSPLPVFRSHRCCALHPGSPR